MPQPLRLSIRHYDRERKNGWGVWDHDALGWAVIDGTRCLNLTRWEARQLVGLITGQEAVDA